MNIDLQTDTWSFASIGLGYMLMVPIFPDLQTPNQAMADELSEIL